jgi:hypothetical protein
MSKFLMLKKKQDAYTNFKYDYLQKFSGQLLYKQKIWSKWVHTTVSLHLCDGTFLQCIFMVEALTFEVIFAERDLPLISFPSYSQNNTDARTFTYYSNIQF